MELKVGDVVEFKNWEYMEDNESKYFVGGFSPRSGKIAEIRNNGSFLVEDRKHVFNQKSIARVISNDVDVDSLKSGDEVLAKVTVKKVFDGFIQINSSVGVSDVVKVLKRITPERFIVKENYYGMYIGVALKLVSNKDTAQVYASRDAAYQEATDMHLNTYDVIPYDD